MKGTVALFNITITFTISLLLLSLRTSATTAFKMTTHSLAARSALSAATISPPMARRDEDAVVYAGVAAGDSSSNLVRQAVDSTERLLHPPVPIPNPYGWLRNDARTDALVLHHLHAENDYLDKMTAHLEPLRATLYKEMLASIQETDYTTPRPRGDWFYYTRTYAGKPYTVHCRAPKTTTEPLTIKWDGSASTPIMPGEQVVLDVNAAAEGHAYCAPGSVAVSPSQQLVAYAMDYSGDETCQLWIRNIVTETIVNHDEALQMSGSIVWGADDTTLFYLKLDQAKRPYQVYRRKLDALEKEDELLFEELDDVYYTSMYKSLDAKYLFIESSSKETSAIYCLDLTRPDAQLELVAQKRARVLYEVEHGNGHWWILSNVGNRSNFALFTSPAIANSQDDWNLVLDDKGNPLFNGDPDRSLDSITCFQDFVVMSGREEGVPRVWIARVNGDCHVCSFERLAFEEDAYDVGLSKHYEFDTDKVVVSYDSLVTPPQSIEIELSDPSRRVVVKEKSVPGYDRTLYGCERTTTLARDGTTEIPVSIVYRQDTMDKHKQTGEAVHVHLYGYGSYGACMEAGFSSTRLTLLNRGVVFVIAHVRGGGEMGRQWYEEPNGAKYLCKKNTFNDFVDVGRWLVDGRKLTKPELLSCEGRSAGGLLIGAAMNQAPDLFKVALLGVPFVDVVCTVRVLLRNVARPLVNYSLLLRTL
jgi:oligopeptidase B